MADPTSSPPQTANGKNVPLWVRIVCGIAAGAVTPWILTQASLAGVNFETLGVNSEIVKGGISGLLTGFAVAPVETFVAVIISIRVALRTIKAAFTSPLPPDQE